MLPPNTKGDKLCQEPVAEILRTPTPRRWLKSTLIYQEKPAISTPRDLVNPTVPPLASNEVCRDPNHPDFKGFVIHCYRETREPSEGLWLVTEDGHTLPMLDRYAIIPIEKYEEHYHLGLK